MRKIFKKKHYIPSEMTKKRGGGGLGTVPKTYKEESVQSLKYFCKNKICTNQKH